MKKNKSVIKTQRKSLDEKLKNFDLAKKIVNPKSGWVKAIRESIGMTTTQLAERMGIQQSGVSLLEKRELNKKISLEILERAAQAMKCKIIYAIVPDDSLEKIVNDQAEKSAHEILKRTLHTMSLEKQDVDAEETKLHHQEIATELKNKLNKKLWDTK